MIVGLIRSIIRTSPPIIVCLSAWRTAVIFARNIPSSIMAVARAVLAFLWRTKRVVIPSVSNTMNDYMKRLYLMVKAQQRAIEYLLCTVMRLSINCQTKQIVVFSSIPLRFIPLSAYQEISLIPYTIGQEKLSSFSTMSTKRQKTS